jgi:MFS family permease
MTLSDARHVKRTTASPVLNVYVARALRDFGDGFVAVLLPVYLIALGFSPFQVGVIATTALFGSALLTLGVGLVGTRYDHRQLLIAAANLMVATGVAFAFVHDYALLAVVAFAGTINPSAGSVSVFVPLEHAVLSREVADSERTRMFARYSLIGAMAGACGALAAAAPDFLSAIGLGQLDAIKAMFVLYALLGVIGGLTYSRIPPRSWPTNGQQPAALGPSRHIVYKLAALFSLDAFAGGFVVQSLLALWLFERFDLSLSAGLFFFWSGVLAAFSFPVAAWLSRHVGLVNTMVFTHIPSSLCLILAAIAPSLPVALALLLLRAALSQNGCTDPLLLRDGGRHRGRASGCRQLHIGAAQLGRCREPGSGGCTVRRIVSGSAPHHLWRPQDRLRRAPPHPVPPRETSRGTHRSTPVLLITTLQLMRTCSCLLRPIVASSPQGASRDCPVRLRLKDRVHTPPSRERTHVAAH